MFTATTATRKVMALKKRIRAIQGGTSASKTISILLVLIHEAQSDTTPTITSVVSESIPHLKRGAMRDFKKIMQAHGYWQDKRWNVQDSTYTFETGSIMEFFSADNADKLRGGRRDRLFINEANNLTLDAFNQLEVRTREYVFLDWNPTIEFWFYTDVLHQRDDVELIILTYKDNEALDPNIVASIEKRRFNKAWFQVYGEGQLGEVEGKIYKDWQIIDHIPHEAKLERYGLDFGYSDDPTACIAVYRFNTGFILDEVLYQKGMSNKQIADTLLNLERALVVADSAEPKSIDELKLYGLTVVPAEKGPDSVNYGIHVVQDQRISMTQRSVNLIREYRRYMWRSDRDGRILPVPEDYDNHAMDALRYALTSIRKIYTTLTPAQKEDMLFRDKMRKKRAAQSTLRGSGKTLFVK